LVIETSGLASRTDGVNRDLREVLDDCCEHKPALITSHLPVDQRHAHLAELALTLRFANGCWCATAPVRTCWSLHAQAEDRCDEDANGLESLMLASIQTFGDDVACTGMRMQGVHVAGTWFQRSETTRTTVSR
jgi:hypothetical protein